MTRDISELRKEIDSVDRELLSLLEKRFHITDEIGRWKSENNYPIFDVTREGQKLQAICNEYSESEYCDKLCAVFKAIMNESKISQSQTVFGKNTVFLIGMPGCGKTSVGKELAELMCANHIDLDAAFKDMFRATPAMFINQMGEDKFRKSESLILKLTLDRINALHARFENAGFVISCGGGIIVREENIARMKDAGTIIYIRRSLEALDKTDRPLSAQKGIEKLYEERKELYEGCSDFSVDNNDVRNCALAILSGLTGFKK